MKIVLQLLLSCCLFPVLLFGQNLDHYFVDMNKSGTEFWFSFPPALEFDGEDANSCRVIVFSPVEQTVSIVVDYHGFEELKLVAANSIVEFELPSEVTQPHRKSLDNSIPHHQVFQQAGISVSALSPICV